VGDMAEGESCGMCCAWHPWGNVFATAFQSGRVAVWDVRSYKVGLSTSHSISAQMPYEMFHSCKRYSGVHHIRPTFVFRVEVRKLHEKTPECSDDPKHMPLIENCGPFNPHSKITKGDCLVPHRPAPHVLISSCYHV
jgi:WD40 repeat protein